jgi:tetratricopeptide (TPR) repeat protein
MGNLAVTYSNLGKYTEAEKLEIQVLDVRNRILGVEHPHTILAMENLAATLRSLGKYKEADKLVIQAQEVNSRVIGATSPYAIATMANVQEAQDISIMNFDKKGVY